MIIGKNFLKDLRRESLDVETAIKDIDKVVADFSKSIGLYYEGKRLNLAAPIMPKAYDDEIKRRFRQAGWRIYFVRTTGSSGITIS